MCVNTLVQGVEARWRIQGLLTDGVRSSGFMTLPPLEHESQENRGCFTLVSACPETRDQRPEHLKKDSGQAHDFLDREKSRQRKLPHRCRLPPALPLTALKQLPGGTERLPLAPKHTAYLH